MKSDTQESTPSGFWAVVELMGHQKIAGYLTETAIAGASFVRVDVPDANGSADYTRLYSAAAIYCINPCDRQIAIGVAANVTKPVSPYDVSKLARDKQVGWPGDSQAIDTGDEDDVV